MYVVHENVVGGSSMIGFPLVIAVSERDMPGIELGPLGWQWHTNFSFHATSVKEPDI